MIEGKVLGLLRSDPDRGADELNALLNEFRNGRNPDEIADLLWSENDELVRIGAWFAKEIPVVYYTPRIVNRLWELTQHNVAAVRFYALGALFPVLDYGDQRTRDLIARLKVDPNEGVRIAAENAASRL